MLILRWFFLFLSFLVFLPEAAYAQSLCTYYVATNGSDDGSGTETSPWRTIQKSVEAAKPYAQHIAEMEEKGVELFIAGETSESGRYPVN